MRMILWICLTSSIVSIFYTAPVSNDSVIRGFFTTEGTEGTETTEILLSYFRGPCVLSVLSVLKIVPAI